MQTTSVDQAVAAVERARVVMAPAVVVVAPQPADAAALAKPRGSTAHENTAQAASSAAAVDLARAALQTSRQATAVVLEIHATADEMGTGPEAATAAASRIQADAEALLALAKRLTRLAQAMHDAAGELRPTPERRRAALAEQLQRLKDDHLALLQRAEAMLAGGSPLSPHQLISAEMCGLGQWRQLAAQAGFGQAPAFLALERPHKALHRAVAGLLFARQQGRADAAAQLQAELRGHTAAVAEAVDELCALILHPNDPAAPVRADTIWSAAD